MVDLTPEAMNIGSPVYSLPAFIWARCISAATSFSVAPSPTASMPASVAASAALAAWRMYSISCADLISRPSSTSPVLSTNFESGISACSFK